MNILDIIVTIPLIWALYKGFKDGIIVQLGGIAGLFLGAWLAFRFGGTVGGWLHGWGVSNEEVASVVGFIIVLLVVIICIALLGRLLRGIFRFAGLVVLDRIGGTVLCVLKTGLIIGLLLYGFDTLNRNTGWVKEEVMSESALYRPLTKLAAFTFPYIDLVKEKLLDTDGQQTDKAENPEDIDNA
jgi:membrane protein required for colicin V production